MFVYCWLILIPFGLWEFKGHTVSGIPWTQLFKGPLLAWSWMLHLTEIPGCWGRSYKYASCYGPWYPQFLLLNYANILEYLIYRKSLMTVILVEEREIFWTCSPRNSTHSGVVHQSYCWVFTLLGILFLKFEVWAYFRMFYLSAAFGNVQLIHAAPLNINKCVFAL